MILRCTIPAATATTRTTQTFLLQRLAFALRLFLVLLGPRTIFGYSSPMIVMKLNSNQCHKVIRIPEQVWRTAAQNHQQRIRTLLLPGLTSLEDPMNSGMKRRPHNKRHDPPIPSSLWQQSPPWEWTTLDPKNPVYNFLIEYYGLKGAKGPRRLARWSPTLNPLVGRDENGILLEQATEDDLGDTLHLRGAMLVENEGIVYSPGNYFGKADSTTVSSREEAAKAATPYLWYRSILQQTLQAEPVLHCHGLHEWAMQYQPEGAPVPPSGKYQAHLPLRVDRETITRTVERKGIHCTHVDALRFFSPAAGPLNHHGSSLTRTDQLRLEQPACVHAHMDLLKIVLRLQPFCGAESVATVLELALQARRLDVAASPYDATQYGVGIIPIETSEGRAQYRSEQRELMTKAEPIRQELLQAYDIFLALAFDEEALALGRREPQAERFAKAEPGGQPWRRNFDCTMNHDSIEEM